MADVEVEVVAGQPKKMTFKKFSFRGVDLDALLDMSTEYLVKLFGSHARRREDLEDWLHSKLLSLLGDKPSVGLW